jgi:hypothetical protein
MDIFFTDDSEIPLPPDEVRILDLNLDPYPDGRRVRLRLELTPFQKPPNGDIVITDNNGLRVGAASFIGAITREVEITLHLRPAAPVGQFTASATLYYTDEIKDGAGDDQVLILPEKKVSHEYSVNFEIRADD